MATSSIKKTINIPEPDHKLLMEICDKTGENATQVILRLIRKEASKC